MSLWASHFKVLHQSFLCDVQGIVKLQIRGSIEDNSEINFLISQ